MEQGQGSVDSKAGAIVSVSLPSCPVSVGKITSVRHVQPSWKEGSTGGNLHFAPPSIPHFSEHQQQNPKIEKGGGVTLKG